MKTRARLCLASALAGMLFPTADGAQTTSTNDLTGNTVELWDVSPNWEPNGIPGFQVSTGNGNSNDSAIVNFIAGGNVTRTPQLDLFGEEYVLSILTLTEGAPGNADGNIINSGGFGGLLFATQVLERVEYLTGARQLDIYPEVILRDKDDGKAFELAMGGSTLDLGGGLIGSEGLIVFGGDTLYVRGYGMSYGSDPTNGLTFTGGSGGSKNFYFDAIDGPVTHDIPNLTIEHDGNQNIDFGRQSGTNMVTVNINNLSLSNSTVRIHLGGGSMPDGTPSTTVNVNDEVDFGAGAAASDRRIRLDSVFGGIVNFNSNIVVNEDLDAANIFFLDGNGVANINAGIVHTNGAARTLTTRIDGTRSLVIHIDAPDRLGTGTIDMRAGSVLGIGYDAYGNATNGGTGFPGASITFGGGVIDDANIFFDFTAPQSGFFDPLSGDTNTPLTVGAFRGISGNLANGVFSGPGQNIMFQTNAILGERATVMPTRADLGGALLYQGIQDAGGTYTNIGDDGATSIFKGVAIGALTPLGNGDIPVLDPFTGVEDTFLSGFHGTLTARPGQDLEVLIPGEVLFTAVNFDTNAQFNADTGVANFRGPGNALFQRRVTTDAWGGNVTNLVRSGLDGTASAENPDAINTQNAIIADLIGAGSLPLLKTMTVIDGQVRMRGADNLGLTSNTTNTTLVIGKGGTLLVDDANNNNAATININRGRLIFEDDGAFYTGPQPDLANANQANVFAAMGFSPNSILVLNDSTGGGGNATPGAVNIASDLYSHLLTNMNIVLGDDAMRTARVQNATSFAIGNDRRLTTPGNSNGNFERLHDTGDTNISITAHDGATRVYLTASSEGGTTRTLNLDVSVNLTNVTTTVGDTNLFTTVNDNSSTRRTVAQAGNVRLDGENNLLGDVEVIGGASLLVGDGGSDVTTFDGDITAFKGLASVPQASVIDFQSGIVTVNGSIIHNATLNSNDFNGSDTLNRIIIGADTNTINGDVIVGPLGEGTGSARLLIGTSGNDTSNVTWIAGSVIIDAPFQPQGAAHNLARGDIAIGSNLIINASGVAAQVGSNASFSATYLRLDADLDDNPGDGIGLADRLVDGTLAQGPDGIVLRDFAELILDFANGGGTVDLPIGQKITIDNTGPNYPGDGANDGIINLARTGAGTLVYQLTNIWMNDGSYLRINEGGGTRALAGITLMGTGTLSLGTTAENEPFELTDVRSDSPGQARVLQIGATNGPNFAAFPTTLLGISSDDVTFDIFNGSLTVTNGSGDVQGGVKVWNGSTFQVIGAASEGILNLAGDGLVLGNVTVSNILSPGLSAGTLTLTGAITFLPTSTLSFELNANDMTVGGGVNDLLSIDGPGGDLTLDGTLDVAGIGSFTNAVLGDTWTLIRYGGLLTSNGLDLGSMPEVTPGFTWALEYDLINQEVNLAIVVPEPASWILAAIGLGLVGLAARRRG